MGLGRLLIFLALLLGLWLAWRWLMGLPQEQAKRYFTRIAIGGIVLLLVVLAATGRLHPLFAAVGAALGGLFTLFTRLLRTPWAISLAQRLFHFYQQNKNRSSASTGQRSQVETRFLRMFLDHETGEMGGEITAGRFAGYRISEMELAQLAILWQDYIKQDPESAALLEAYLDRIHGETWRQQCSMGEEGGADQAPMPNGQMSPDEASKILGIKPDATEEEIIQAHRRLAQRLHPDRGGSTYLAAKINRAKQVLVDK